MKAIKIINKLYHQIENLKYCIITKRIKNFDAKLTINQNKITAKFTIDSETTISHQITIFNTTQTTYFIFTKFIKK